MSVPLYRSQYLQNVPLTIKSTPKFFQDLVPGRLLDAVFNCSALFVVSGDLALADQWTPQHGVLDHSVGFPCSSPSLWEPYPLTADP